MTEKTRREHLSEEGGETVELVADAYYRGYLDARNAAANAITSGHRMPLAAEAAREFMGERVRRLHISGMAYEIAEETGTSSTSE